MTLQFEHILSGIGRGTGKPQHQAFIDGTALCIEKSRPGGAPRWRRATGQAFDPALQIGTGDANDPDAAAPGGSGDGGNRIA